MDCTPAPLPIDATAIAAALALEAAAVDRCLVLAHLVDVPAPARRRAAHATIDAWERAARTVDALLDLALVTGCPGLLRVLEAAETRAAWGQRDAQNARAYAVSDHAWDVAARRVVQALRRTEELRHVA